MQIAYTMTGPDVRIDPLLDQFAQALAAQGMRLAGIVQANSERADGAPCDMDVRVMPDGPELRISQFRGKEARGCRLDPSNFETAVGHVEASLAVRPDLLIVNKFGKQEAAGRGMRGAIGTALAMEVPVLVGLNGMNRAAFDAFTGGAAAALQPTPDALMRWWDGCRDRADVA